MVKRAKTLAKTDTDKPDVSEIVPKLEGKKLVGLGIFGSEVLLYFEGGYRLKINTRATVSLERRAAQGL